MATFAPQAVVPQLVAASALTQLNQVSIFPRTGLGSYEPGAFERGDTVVVRRAKIVKAIDYDPRSGIPATSIEPGYFNTQLTLERLFTAGFPVFGHDARDSLTKYVPEYSEQIAASIATEVDDYFYNKFRTVPPTFPSIGAVAYGAHPPVAITASVDNNGQLIDFNKNALLYASGILDREKVPPANRYAVLSTSAKTSFLGDAVLVEGFAGAMAGGAGLITTGLPTGQFAPRYGFLVGGSPAIGNPSQLALPLDAAITAVAQDISAFFVADIGGTVPTPLGAVTLTVSSVTGLAIGQIARIGTTTNAKAFGYVLRIAGSAVTLVPYSPNGQQLRATDIDTATDRLTVPKIPSVNVAYHREALLFTTRNLAGPTDGSGATMVSIADPNTGMSVQILRGSYQVDSFKESQRAACLCGALLSDYRKAVFMLSL